MRRNLSIVQKMETSLNKIVHIRQKQMPSSGDLNTATMQMIMIKQCGDAINTEVQNLQQAEVLFGQKINMVIISRNDHELASAWTRWHQHLGHLSSVWQDITKKAYGLMKGIAGAQPPIYSALNAFTAFKDQLGNFMDQAYAPGNTGYTGSMGGGQRTPWGPQAINNWMATSQQDVEGSPDDGRAWLDYFNQGGTFQASRTGTGTMVGNIVYQDTQGNLYNAGK